MGKGVRAVNGAELALTRLAALGTLSRDRGRGRGPSRQRWEGEGDGIQSLVEYHDVGANGVRPTPASARDHRRAALWQHLRDRRLAGFKFRRQRPIGRHVADFVCMERRLIVELDGSQHDWQAGVDERRTAVLGESGYRVIRFWNNDVLSNTEGVLQQILDALTGRD